MMGSFSLMDTLVVLGCLARGPIVVVMVHMMSVMIIIRLPIGVAVVAAMLVPLFLFFEMSLGS